MESDAVMATLIFQIGKDPILDSAERRGNERGWEDLESTGFLGRCPRRVRKVSRMAVSLLTK